MLCLSRASISCVYLWCVCLSPVCVCPVSFVYFLRLSPVSNLVRLVSCVPPNASISCISSRVVVLCCLVSCCVLFCSVLSCLVLCLVRLYFVSYAVRLSPVLSCIILPCLFCSASFASRLFSPYIPLVEFLISFCVLSRVCCFPFVVSRPVCLLCCPVLYCLVCSVLLPLHPVCFLHISPWWNSSHLLRPILSGVSPSMSCVPFCFFLVRLSCLVFYLSHFSLFVSSLFCSVLFNVSHISRWWNSYIFPAFYFALSNLVFLFCLVLFLFVYVSHIFPCSVLSNLVSCVVSNYSSYSSCSSCSSCSQTIPKLFARVVRVVRSAGNSGIGSECSECLECPSVRLVRSVRGLSWFVSGFCCLPWWLFFSIPSIPSISSILSLYYRLLNVRNIRTIRPYCYLGKKD